MDVASVVVYLGLLTTHKLIWSLHELLQVFKVLNVVVADTTLAMVVVVLVLYTNFLYLDKLLNLV